MHIFSRSVWLGAAAGLALGAAAAAAGAPIPVKVIVLTGFEVGADRGDAPGEFQYWVEREGLDETVPVRGSPHVLRRNAAGLYGSVIGSTDEKGQALSTVPAAELVMALALDPRFDLRKTYWIISGIGGIDPAFGSIGSAVWADHVVDGDAMREISEAEAPRDWPWGLYAIGAKAPGLAPGRAAGDSGGWGGAELVYSMDYALNGGFVRWALEQSLKAGPLPDSPALAAARAAYRGFPAAQTPPAVGVGAHLGSARYWHGEKRTAWAREWTRLWTQGASPFASTAMETAVYVGTLKRLAQRGLVDADRVLLMRGCSNYCMPPPGVDVLVTAGDESAGTDIAFEAAYRAAAPVAHELLANWERHENVVPSAPAEKAK